MTFAQYVLSMILSLEIVATLVLLTVGMLLKRNQK